MTMIVKPPRDGGECKRVRQVDHNKSRQIPKAVVLIIQESKTMMTRLLKTVR